MYDTLNKTKANTTTIPKIVKPIVSSVAPNKIGSNILSSS